MGLESVPFLAAIITAIGHVLKWLADVFKRNAVLIGVFFVRLGKFVWNYVHEWVTYKYLLIAGLILLIGSTVRQALILLDYALDIRSGWDYVLEQMPGFAWFFWNEDGILRFKKVFTGLFEIFPYWLGGMAVCLAIRAQKFLIMAALNAKLGRGS